MSLEELLQTDSGVRKEVEVNHRITGLDERPDAPIEMRKG